MTTIGDPKATVEYGSPPIRLSTIFGCATFSELVFATGGRHPTELVEILRGFDTPDLALRRHVQGLLEDATIAVNARQAHPQGVGLALPHPLDCEWRFTDSTADDLLSAAGIATKSGDTILLMGVPSVVVAASRSSHDRRFSVVGEHNVISEGLRNLTANDARFVHGDPVGPFAAAILDPPWYPDQFCSMLGDAAANCIIGANIFLSAPSASVRPSIPEDLRRIGEMAARCGLELVGSSPGKLKYRTPLFEMNALRAAGIGAWLPEWRRGDERVYRKSSHGIAWISEPFDRSGFEITLAGIRLRLLDVAAGEGTDDLVPIHPGGVFPSVSMRAPRRSEAVLWTSGNRAFNVDHAACLTALAKIAEDRGLLPEGLFPKISSAMKPDIIDRINSLIQKLLEVAEREFAEATNVLGPDAWDTAANDARFLSDSRKSSL